MIFPGPQRTRLLNILGLPPTATRDEVNKAYKKLSLKWHPDKPSGNAEKFKEIANAKHDLIGAGRKTKHSKMCPGCHGKGWVDWLPSSDALGYVLKSGYNYLTNRIKAKKEQEAHQVNAMNEHNESLERARKQDVESGEAERRRERMMKAREENIRNGTYKGRGRPRKIVMPKGEYLQEHKHLINILENPTPKSLKAEAKKQLKEVRSKGLKIKGKGTSCSKNVVVDIMPARHVSHLNDSFERGRVISQRNPIERQLKNETRKAYDDELLDAVANVRSFEHPELKYVDIKRGRGRPRKY
jgi:hypothetical protein